MSQFASAYPYAEPPCHGCSYAYFKTKRLSDVLFCDNLARRDSNSESVESKTRQPSRFEPSSRTFLIGEQPNAWDLLQPRAKVSRHRGAELRRRYGRLGGTSLLSPG